MEIVGREGVRGCEVGYIRGGVGWWCEELSRIGVEMCETGLEGGIVDWRCEDYVVEFGVRGCCVVRWNMGDGELVPSLLTVFDVCQPTTS
jgi:hypothetical protein